MTRQILPVPNPVPSYWLAEPHRLADLQSTPRLPAQCDVAVVGAGLAGVLSAYYILKSTDDEDLGRRAGGAADGATDGATDGNGSREKKKCKWGPPSSKVLLLDARQLCSGATGRNGGHVKVQVNTLLNLPGSDADNGGSGGGARRTAFQDYVARVASELGRVVEEESLDCEFQVRRSFDVFTHAEDARKAWERFEKARCNGEGWTRNVSWIEASIAEQVTSVVGAKGAFSVPAASFWPYKFVTQLLARMLERWPDRLNVQMNTPVLSLSSSSSSGVDNVLATHRGTITARNLVLATNAYTSGLVPSFSRAIVPVRGMASHHRPTHPINPPLTHTYNINFGPGAGVDYLNPRPDGGIVVGGGAWRFASDTHSWLANWDDAYLFPAEVMRYWEEGYVERTFVGGEECRSVADFVWTGIMGRTGDGQPLVGRVPGSERAWVLAGFNGGGMAIIALCARAVASMVVEGKEFGDVCGEEGLLREFECTEERLGRL